MNILLKTSRSKSLFGKSGTSAALSRRFESFPQSQIIQVIEMFLRLLFIFYNLKGEMSASFTCYLCTCALDNRGK